MKMIWLGLLLAAPAFAVCPAGEGKIGYTFCVRYTILEVKSYPAWMTRLLYGKRTYGHRKVLRVRVEDVSLPQAELQPKDAHLKLMPGNVLKFGIADDDHRDFQAKAMERGLVEEECHDKGPADYEFVLQKKLAGQAVGPTGMGRNVEVEVDCTPPAAVPVPPPGEPASASDTKAP